MNSLKTNLFIGLVLFIPNLKLMGQAYSGAGVDIVNQLLVDSTLLDNVHLELTLETKGENGQTQMLLLSYRKFGENWSMKNSSYLLLGNSDYQVTLDTSEKLIILSEELETQSLSSLFKKNRTIETADFEQQYGSVVVFDSPSDSQNQVIRYTVDTADQKLLSTEIMTFNNDGNQVGSYKIGYNLVEHLPSDSSITMVSSILTIKRKKAILLSPYTNYFLYDNRKKP